MSLSGIAGVQARIGEIRSRFGASSAPRTASQPTFNEVYATAAQAADAAASPPAQNSATGAAVVAEAEKYLGVPYVFASSDPSVGLDCSGLLKRVFAAFGIQLPHQANAQASYGTAVVSMADARPGDLVAFNNTDDPSRPYIDHIGIYVGDGMMIHAPRTGGVVEYAKVPTGDRAPVAIRRLTPEAPSLPPAPPPPSLGPATSIQAPSGLGLPPDAVLFGPGADMTPVGTDTPYAPLFNAAGARYQVAPRLLAALASVGSGFRAGAVGADGAAGLMQLSVVDAAQWGIDPTDPVAAVDAAGRILAALYADTGTVEAALAAYLGDQGAVRRYGEVPPSEETQAHGRLILQLIGRLQ